MPQLGGVGQVAAADVGDQRVGDLLCDGEVGVGGRQRDHPVGDFRPTVVEGALPEDVEVDRAVVEKSHGILSFRMVYASQMTSISSSAFFGSSATWQQALAGGVPLKKRP